MRADCFFPASRDGFVLFLAGLLTVGLAVGFLIGWLSRR